MADGEPDRHGAQDQGAEGGPDPDEQQPEGGEGNDQVAALRREAASYRRKLREAEDAQTKLARALIAEQRRAVETVAAARLESPEDLWLGGVELDDLRGEDGALDAELVQTALDRVLADHPHWRKPGGFDGGARRTPDRPEPSFGEALKGARPSR